ncbi:MAG: hypothetical protein ACKO1W_08080 [Microcystaceae cyanobacterium]
MLLQRFLSPKAIHGENDNIMERVDQQGNIIGFSVMNVCQLSQEKPLIAQLMATNEAA